jgi:hypothetical protein
MEIEALGSEYMNCEGGEQRSAFRTRWVQHYAVDPKVITHVWNLLDIDPNNEDQKNLEPGHLLWAIMFLTMYTGESDLAGKCSGVDEDTYRLYCWELIDYIALLAPEVVSICLMRYVAD